MRGAGLCREVGPGRAVGVRGIQRIAVAVHHVPVLDLRLVDPRDHDPVRVTARGIDGRRRADRGEPGVRRGLGSTVCIYRDHTVEIRCAKFRGGVHKGNLVRAGRARRGVIVAAHLGTCYTIAGLGRRIVAPAYLDRGFGRAVLGADLGPALASTSQIEFLTANGEILNQVDATNFPVRARGLAAEILQLKPDLVGLQEVALWRTGPFNLDPINGGPKTATTVKQDFLALLLARLNRRGKQYRAVKVQQQFDFEAPAAYTELINGRLTMRDVILVRRGAGIKVRGARGGNFRNLFTPSIAGITVPVTRGWTRIEAKVRKSPWFRFANAHFEAFDDETQRPSIRAQQAQEFARVTKRTKRPVVILGDFNSDRPGVKPGDEQAYTTLLRNGFRDRGTRKPLSCCIKGSYDLQAGGSRADFDHRVDQIMTSTPRKVRRLRSRVTGLRQINGFWNSDHAGVFSVLRIRK